MPENPNNNIEILGITCVGGNSTLENTKLNALKICTLINRTDIKIYAGSNKPLHSLMGTLMSSIKQEVSSSEWFLNTFLRLVKSPAVNFIEILL